MTAESSIVKVITNNKVCMYILDTPRRNLKEYKMAVSCILLIHDIIYGSYHTRGTRLRNHTNRERYFPELYYIAAKNYVLFLYLINTIQIRRQGQNDSNTQLVLRSNHI
jgi:hypothetical protein